MPRRYVLDTHACVFMLSAPQRLGARARAALREVEAGRHEAWVPAAVVAEVVMLRELGRAGIGIPELRDAMDQAPNFRFLPLDLSQLDGFAGLARFRDPFDRLIVAATRTLGGILVTRDVVVVESGLVQTIWA